MTRPTVIEVEWPHPTLGHIRAQIEDGRWRFWNQEAGEVRWYTLEATPPLIAKARRLFIAQSQSSPDPAPTPSWPFPPTHQARRLSP
jgi:hypothetical protein